MIETVLPADIVAAARDRRAAADAAEADLLDLACQWADAHPGDECDHATFFDSGRDTGLTIAGEGCPLVAEFAVTEFASALKMSTESGKRLIGHAMELRHRLPRIWHRVQDGEVQPWRARQVAERTTMLSPEAAEHVDRHLARFVHSAKPSQITRLIDAAIARFMPEVAAERRRKALDGRHVDIDTHQVSYDGTCHLYGELDLTDALDLDEALQAGAETLKQCGSEESLDARRSIALGDLARGNHPLNLAQPPEVEPVETPQPPAVEPVVTKHRKRKSTILLHLHLSEEALRDSSITGSVEEGRTAVTAGTIRDWCGASNVIVKPVIDLNADLSTDAYAVPDRIREQVTLRSPMCVFPYCTRPSRRLDVDHIDAYDPAGPPGQSASHNLAPLCRQHHRAKTHDHRGQGWAYTQLEPGVFLWRSPLGLVFLRNADGTTDLTPDTWPHRPSDPPGAERD